ncbi:PREDICTED: protein SUPPRESSOR OF npr1-1, CONSTITUTIVE 1-like [Fragaria vesca subsp. vesca]
MDVPSSSSSNTHTFPSSSSGSSSNWEHDVFLSFRGEDTRNNFTEHLYHAFNQKGINAFRDTEKLPKGKFISQELLKAIKESKFAVTVLSANYATSSWCLDELTHIVECNKVRGLEVLPVFYRVDPSEIRKQTGNYGEAFAKYLKDNMRQVEDWRNALMYIGSLSGWHVTQDRRESEVIQEIVDEILKVLNRLTDDPERGLIGMGTRIKEIESRLDLESNGVLTIGIWGLGGIGKTTLAREVFKKIRNQFHVSGFVSHVRSRSEVELQQRLCESFLGDGNFNIDTVEKGIKLLEKALKKKKVLIILDEVDNFRQIECLAPGGPLGEDIWGGGSRLIITTRDRSLLRNFNVQDNKIYEVEKLREDEALQLLCQTAFKKVNPPEEFAALSKSLLQYACGLPLALKVLGSTTYLSRPNVDEWSEILHRLDHDKDKDIFSVLQISFDGLHETDKKIFLDIACFFNGEDHIRVKNILGGCGFSSKMGISNLIDRSLIKIEGNKLWMNDLVRCLGWHIVREESYSFPGQRSRLWLDGSAHMYEGRSSWRSWRSWRFEDARDVLMYNYGTSAVEGLFLSLPEKEEMSLKHDPFLKMCDLRLLKIYNVNFPDVHFGCVSEKLGLLEWHGCPLESLPSDFKSKNLVEIKMPSSRIKQLWNEKISLEMLILMDLSNCQYLTVTPDFSTVPNLKRLILQGCKKLSEVYFTMRDLHHLVFLNLKGCTSLKSLPQYISMSSLQTFILSGCSELQEFPEIGEKMDTLSELYLDGTAISELPESIQHLKGLILLNLSGCRNLLSLPRILCSSLTSLKFLHLSLCSRMDRLPDNIGCLEHLEELDACNTAIRKVPNSISDLKNLELLCFHGCCGLAGLELPNKFSGLTSLKTLNLGGCSLTEGAIPEDIGDLLSLQSLDLSENNFFTIPKSISQLSELTEMSLFKCSKLQSLPKDLLSSIRNVTLGGCPELKNSSSSWRGYPPQMGSSIINCRKPEEEEAEIFPELHKFPLENLEVLDLSYFQQLKKIPDLSGVPNLKKLNLEGCVKLSEVHSTIGCLQHLVFLNLKGCVDLERLPGSISLKSLKIFVLSGCSKLKEFPNIKGDMNNLSQLHLDGTALRHLQVPATHLKGLILISLSGCRNLLTVPIVFGLKSLNLSRCSTLSKLSPSLANMEHLEEFDASETAIKGLPQSISYMEKLKVLSFCGCKGLQLPKWFSDLRSLTSLNLQRCGLAEEVIDRLYSLSVLQILDLSGNNLSIIPNGIGRLSSLKLLNLSENNFDDIPNEIGHLYSLQVLDLSENNFMSLPESISHLSELTELRLFRCSKLQSLPNNLLFSLKLVHAQECPLLNYNADTLTIWPSGRGFCFINCRQSDQDDGQPKHLKVPVRKDHIELLFPTYIKDRLYGKKPFEIRFPHSTRIPNSWSRWENGPSVTIPLSDVNSTWMGLALFIVFEILEQDIFNKSWEFEKTVCEFHTEVGHDTSLVFQNFMDFTTGSYGLCCYEPRGGQFSRLFDKPSSWLRASVSTKRPNLKLRGCGIHLISEEDAAEFVQSLAYQTATQHLDFNFDRHCECILDEEATADLMEQGSTLTFSEDSCSEINSKLRGELSILYEVLCLCLSVSLSHR